ncbi:MAG: hypothetical protein ACI943_000887 [Gammaproteobacteria bacterium]|jgi:hypothetical protein
MTVVFRKRGLFYVLEFGRSVFFCSNRIKRGDYFGKKIGSD